MTIPDESVCDLKEKWALHVCAGWMNGWMEGRLYWLADLDCWWRVKWREKRHSERNRSQFHLCSVPLCERLFAVVISADVFHPVRKLQLSAAANKPHILRQPGCLSHEPNESLWRSCNVPIIKSAWLFPNKLIFSATNEHITSVLRMMW